jgi:hypothetical protein
VILFLHRLGRLLPDAVNSRNRPFAACREWPLRGNQSHTLSTKRATVKRAHRVERLARFWVAGGLIWCVPIRLPRQLLIWHHGKIDIGPSRTIMEDRLLCKT